MTEVPIAPNDVMARLDRAEARIRELTGQVEELAFRLHQTQTQLQAALGGQPLPNAAAAPQPVTPLPNTGATVAAAQPSGQVVIDAPQNQPIDLTAMARGGAEQPAAPVAPTQVVSLGEPGADYERAYAAILAGDYILAEASFRGFIATYPGDQRVVRRPVLARREPLCPRPVSRRGRRIPLGLQGLSEERQGGRHPPQARPVARRPRRTRGGLLDLCRGPQEVSEFVERAPPAGRDRAGRRPLLTLSRRP